MKEKKDDIKIITVIVIAHFMVSCKENLRFSLMMMMMRSKEEHLTSYFLFAVILAASEI